MNSQKDSETVWQKVREGYGKVAVSGGSCCGPTPTCCGSAPAASENLAKLIGYSAVELATLPEGARAGLGRKPGIGLSGSLSDIARQHL